MMPTSRRWVQSPVTQLDKDGEQYIIDMTTGQWVYKARDSMAGHVMVVLLNEAEDRVNATMGGAGDGPG